MVVLVVLAVVLDVVDDVMVDVDVVVVVLDLVLVLDDVAVVVDDEVVDVVHTGSLPVIASIVSDHFNLLKALALCVHHIRSTCWLLDDMRPSVASVGNRGSFMPPEKSITKRSALAKTCATSREYVDE